ncbi:serine hydrolase domain-containing protein [Luteipulveratus mongoliensis]|uniref:Beta-lactamase-related domain-containing protein n=1 Tax=Luteipulveratus mongoliensis TaxID=571913 RepID=A0A0K1JNN7_9MICO|nr:serine hydrolase domain-containing protein [Luteipulveratus mongoliensis]AKU18327.1 hypothetical protein VV02_24915 [Luteipulveratus mongoliensis]
MRHLRTAGTTLATLTALAVGTTGVAHADVSPIPPVEPQAVHLKPTGKATAPLQTYLDEMTRDGAVAVVARAQGPHVRWAGSAGVRQRGTQREARPGDQFRVGSVTKTMVATLALQEIQRGHWTLSTTVDQVLPGLLPGHGDVTLEQLLSHRSGLPDGLIPMISSKMHGDSDAAFVAALGEPATAQEFVAAGLTQPWSFPSGTDYAYSNSNYIVVGMMLQKATGQPVKKLLERRVFWPAGMHETTFPTRPGLRRTGLVESGRFAEGWLSLAGQDPTQFGAAGAVVSTTRDLNAFTSALMSGRLVRKSLVDQMVRPRSSAPDVEYGLGIYRLPDPCTKKGQPQQYVYGHDGATFGTYAIAFTSADGRRQISAGWTGRHFTDPTGKQPFDINPWALAALQKTC